MNSDAIIAQPTPPYLGFNYTRVGNNLHDDDEIIKHKNEIEMILTMDDDNTIRKIGSGLINHDLGYIVIALCLYIYQAFHIFKVGNDLTHVEIFLAVVSTLHIVAGVILYLMRMKPSIGKFMSVHHLFSVIWTVSVLLTFTVTSDVGSRLGLSIYCSLRDCPDDVIVNITSNYTTKSETEFNEKMSRVMLQLDKLLPMLEHKPTVVHTASRPNVRAFYNIDTLKSMNSSPFLERHTRGNEVT